MRIIISKQKIVSTRAETRWFARNVYECVEKINGQKKKPHLCPVADMATNTRFYTAVVYVAQYIVLIKTRIEIAFDYNATTLCV